MVNSDEYKISKIVQTSPEYYTLSLILPDGTLEKQTVASGVLATIGIVRPQTISGELYQQIKTQAEFYKYYIKALNYLSFRKRAELEVRNYLKEKCELQLELIEQIISQLQAQKYLDDDNFVISYVQNALITSLKGPGRIKRELGKLNCQTAQQQAIVEKLFTPIKQQEQLIRILKKLLKKQYFSVFQCTQKIQLYMYEQGYNKAMISIFLQQHSEIIANDITIDKRKIEQLLTNTWRKTKKQKLSAYEQRQKLINILVNKQVDMGESYEIVEIFLQENEKGAADVD